MAGVRQMTAEERKAYGLPPLSDEEQEQIDAAKDAKVQRALDENRMTSGVDKNGNEILREKPGATGWLGLDANGGKTPQDRIDEAKARRAGTTTGAPGGPDPNMPFGIGPTRSITPGKVDSFMFTDPTYDPNKKMLADALSKRAAQPALSMTGAKLNVDPSGAAMSADTRGRQMGLVDALTAASQGRGPSAAQSALQAGTDQAMRNSMALARSGTGNPSVAMKGALLSNAELSQQAANTAAGIAANEQNAARSQLVGALEGVRGQDLGQRGQDIGIATTQAGLDQDTGKTNLAAALQEKQQLDEMTKYYTSLGLTLDQAQAAARQRYEELRVEAHLRNRAADVGQFQAETQRDNNTAQLVAGLIGTGVNAVGSAIKGS